MAQIHTDQAMTREASKALATIQTILTRQKACETSHGLASPSFPASSSPPSGVVSMVFLLLKESTLAGFATAHHAELCHTLHQSLRFNHSHQGHLPRLQLASY